MSASDSDLRRVAVHADGADVDLVVPATVPVAALIPSILDVLGSKSVPATRYRLGPLGGPALLSSTTLAQNAIRDGAYLVLTGGSDVPPSRSFAEDAEAVAAALTDCTRSRQSTRITGALAAVAFTAVGALLLMRIPSDHATAVAAAAAGVIALLSGAVAFRTYRDSIAGLAFNIIAVLFAAMAGRFAVPGAPAAPHVLLAATASAAAAVLAIRLTQCGVVILAAAAGGAVIVAGAALAGVTMAAPPHVIGSLIALACLGLIEAAPRMSVKLAGLTPHLEPEITETPQAELASRALRGDAWLTSLRAAFAADAGGGAAVAALATPRGIALAVVTAGLLLLHAQTDRRRAQLFISAGIGTTAMTFVAAGSHLPMNGPATVALTVALAAGATFLGFVAPAMSPSPIARRFVDALRCVALTAVVPLACWTCGTFAAVRGLNLIRT